MLRQRIVTAIVLIAILLPALFAHAAWPFALLSLVLISAAGWEWGRLNGGATPSVVMAVLLALACGAGLWAHWSEAPPRMVWWLATAVWVIGGAGVLRGGPAGWPTVPVALRCLLGLLILWTAWLALAAARSVGVNFLLSILCLVWSADIAAYFGGRAFGRRRLAPSISPGKSWEGVWSGVAGGLLLAGLWVWLDSALQPGSMSFYTRLDQRVGRAGGLVVVVFLSMMSVVGDLFESLIKRAAGAKDSSQLLPGHGGVLDRVDAMLPVLPIAMAMISF